MDWLLGHTAIAKISAGTYAKITILKDENGLFYGDKVLALDPFTEKMCLFVKNVRTGDCFWIPQDCLTLAERSRPFYGISVEKKSKVDEESKPIKKRKLHKDLVLPLEVPKKVNKLSPDVNTSNSIVNVPKMDGKPNNEYLNYLNRLQDKIFDMAIVSSDQYKSSSSSTFEEAQNWVFDTFAHEKEIQYYLNQCWSYVSLQKELDCSAIEEQPVEHAKSIHISWCLVCGQSGALSACTKCPAAFHPACHTDWPSALLHRRNSRVEVVSNDDFAVCPSCFYGPGVGIGDIVWHRMSGCPWWPAKVLDPGTLPSCLLTKKHPPQHLPLRYYRAQNYAWGSLERICLLLPSHGNAMSSIKSPDVRDALFEACDDYIIHYIVH